MVEIFLRTTSRKSRLRQAFFDATMARWYLDKEAAVTVVYDYEIRTARLMAEQAATSDPYIFTDDDVVIHGKNWIERGVKAMLAHPEYAICSTLSLIEGENLAKGEGDIYEIHSVGAPMWIRKGIIKEDLPEFDLNMECGAIFEYVTRKGYKEGLISGIRHMHLGNGFSSTPGLDYGA